MNEMDAMPMDEADVDGLPMDEAEVDATLLASVTEGPGTFAERVERYTNNAAFALLQLEVMRSDVTLEGAHPTADEKRQILAAFDAIERRLATARKYAAGWSEA